MENNLSSDTKAFAAGMASIFSLHLRIEPFISKGFERHFDAVGLYLHHAKKLLKKAS